MINVWNDRVVEASDETLPLTLRLIAAAEDAGYYCARVVDEAVRFCAINLDPEADDYETWETTLLARLENPNSGER